MGRIFVIAVLVWIAYFLVKKIGKALLASSSPRDQASGGPASDAELIRDPQCGAYFLKQKGVKGVVEGQVIHFCSEQCYDNYLKSRSRN
jgi:hypothetical protein